MKSRTDPLLEVQNIVLSYGSFPVIEDLSTTIFSGSFVGLIGPNGAGKTTLLLSLSGQFKPQKGRILFENFDIYKRNIEFKQVIGYVHENPFFYPYLSAEEFLYLVARMKQVAKSVMESQISFVLESVCLYEERQKLTSNLSLGMRKKLAIAAAILGSPKLIFLDEALNGIDVESTFHIKNLLNNLVAEGKTIFLATHVLEIIEKICDRYIVLKNGKIIADLKADRLKQSRISGEDIDLEKYVIQLLNA